MAADIQLSDLYGYSLALDWTIEETETSETRPNEYVTTKHFSDKVYISSRGRLFHAGSKIINNEDRGSYASISSKPSDPMIYVPGVGFVTREIPSYVNFDKTTFARVTTASVERAGDGYSCAVSARLALKKGEKEYVFFSNIPQAGSVYRIHSFATTRSSCSISKGNPFEIH